jgi:hypothetical protein
VYSEGVTDKTEYVKSAFVDFGSTIGDHAHDDFLPAIWAPRLRPVPGTKMCNILDDASKRMNIGSTSMTDPILRIHCLSEQDFVFVVHRHDDKQLRLTAHQVRS